LGFLNSCDTRCCEARPLPPLPRPAAAKPAWLRCAAQAPATGNRPLVAIALDDLGLDCAEAIRLRAPAAIANQLARVEQLARQHGTAIATGHPHDATIAALDSWLPTFAGKGLALVPVSAVVQHRMAEEVDARR